MHEKQKGHCNDPHEDINKNSNPNPNPNTFNSFLTYLISQKHSQEFNCC